MNDIALPTRHRPETVRTSSRSSLSGLTTRLASVLVVLILTVGLLGACGSSGTSTSSPTASGSGTATATVGTCPASNTKHFAKTKFLLHAGLAFGAFHRYLYKPLKAGSFSKGAHGRIFTFIKAGAAAVYIEHEIRLTSGDVQANPTLCKVIASPLRSLSTDISGAVGQLHSGNTAGVLGAQSSLGSITSLAKNHGSSIVDQAVPSLG